MVVKSGGIPSKKCPPWFRLKIHSNLPRKIVLGVGDSLTHRIYVWYIYLLQLICMVGAAIPYIDPMYYSLTSPASLRNHADISLLFFEAGFDWYE